MVIDGSLIPIIAIIFFDVGQIIETGPKMAYSKNKKCNHPSFEPVRLFPKKLAENTKNGMINISINNLAN